jgi:hypothetical protein
VGDGESNKLLITSRGATQSMNKHTAIAPLIAWGTLVATSLTLYFWQIAGGYNFTPALYARSILLTGHLVSPTNLNQISYWYSSSTIGLEQAYPAPSILYTIVSEVLGLNLQQVPVLPFLSILIIMPFIWARSFGLPAWAAVLFTVSIGPIGEFTVGRHSLGLFFFWMAATVLILEIRNKGRTTANLILILIFLFVMGLSHYGATFLFTAGLAGLMFYQLVQSRVKLQYPFRTKFRLFPAFLVGLLVLIFGGSVSVLAPFAVFGYSNLQIIFRAYEYRIFHPFSIPVYTAPASGAATNPLLNLLHELSALYLPVFLLVDMVAIAYFSYKVITGGRITWAGIFALALFIFGTVLGDYVSYGIAQSPGSLYYGASILSFLLFAPLIGKMAFKRHLSISKTFLRIAILTIVSLLCLTAFNNIQNFSQSSNVGLGTVYPFEFSQLTAASDFLNANYGNQTDLVLSSSFGVSSIVTEYLSLSALKNVAVQPFEYNAYNVGSALPSSKGLNRILNDPCLYLPIANCEQMSLPGIAGMILYKEELSHYMYGDANGYAFHAQSYSGIFGVDVIYSDPYSMVILPSSYTS